MNTYEVEIVETLSRIITVKTTSEEDAVQEVINAYKHEDIVLDCDDFKDVEINLYKNH